MIDGEPRADPGFIPSALHAVDAAEVEHVKEAALAAAAAHVQHTAGAGGGVAGSNNNSTLKSAARAAAVAAVTAAADALSPAPDVDPDTHDHVAIVLSHHFQDE